MKIRITSAVRRDGKLHGPGAVLTLDEGEARRLIEGGSAVEAPPDEPDEDGLLVQAVDTVARILGVTFQQVLEALQPLTAPAGEPLPPVEGGGGHDAGPAAPSTNTAPDEGKPPPVDGPGRPSAATPASSPSKGRGGSRPTKGAAVTGADKTADQ